MKTDKKNLITAEMLIKELQRLPPKTPIDFSGLDFFRFKTYTLDDIVQIQFHQYVEVTDDGKIIMTHPYITNKPATLKHKSDSLK